MDLLVHRKQSWITPVSTCGLMDIDGVFFGYTLERETAVAIPLGGPYPVYLDQSFHFNQTLPSWYLKAGRQVPHIGGVEGRTGLEIHPANWATELKGCVAVGADHYEDYQYPGTNIRGGAIFGSDNRFLLLMTKLKAAKDPIQISFVEEP